MSRGPSGRIVLEIDPQLKGDLYVELARRNMTLKAWFVSEAKGVVRTGGQMPLFSEPDLGARSETGAEAEFVATQSEDKS